MKLSFFILASLFLVSDVTGQKVKHQSGPGETYHPQSAQENEAFVTITDDTLRFSVETATSEQPPLKAIVRDQRGKEINAEISPVQTQALKNRGKGNRSSSISGRYQIQLSKLKLKNGSYTLIVTGLKSPLYLRFKLETEDVEN
jgi:hypothetical protein